MRSALLAIAGALTLAGCSGAGHDGGATAGADPSGMAVTEDRLQSHPWRLSAATDASGRRIEALFAQPRRPLQLDFAGGRLVVRHACNQIGGRYRVEQGRLRLAELAQTLMACPPGPLARLDQAIGSRLRAEPALQLEPGPPPRLLLRTDAGDVLTFTGEPAAAGMQGDRDGIRFLEVARATVPCPDGAAPACLRVRDIPRRGDGLLALRHPGPWRTLRAPIQGYRHEQGVRNVLRVRAVGTDAAPAYVLDRVIESDTRATPATARSNR